MRSTTTEEWLLPLLNGFRFHPPEEEIVNLLRKKMKGQGSQAMPEINYKPWNLPDNESISLFLRFLKQMMQGKDSQACHIIPEINVCKYEPSDLAGQGSCSSLYCCSYCFKQAWNGQPAEN